MKSRKPILFLAIVLALVCVYQLSFTWKESNVDKEKKAYAESQFEINKTNDINNINSRNVANNLRMNLINIDFADSLQQNNINFWISSNNEKKEILFELDSSYYKINKPDGKPILIIDTNIIEKYQTNLDSFIVYSMSDILIDSSEIRKVIEEKRSETKNNYNTNRISILKNLEYQYISSISFDSTGKDLGVFNLLLKNYTYQECKDRELNLGLDLKGGISVTLEVDIRDVLENYSINDEENKEYREFISKLNNADENKKSSSEGYLNLVYQEYSDVLNEKDNLSVVFSNRDMNEEMRGLSNKEVLDKLRDKIEGKSGIISTTLTTLEERSERFANIRPNLLTVPGIKGRFIVELPGADDVNRVNSILTDPAQLEFWEAYKLDEVYIASDMYGFQFNGLTEGDANIMLEWRSIVGVPQYLLTPSEDGVFGPVIGLSNSTNQDKLKELFNKLEKLLKNVKFSYGYADSDKTRKTLQIYALKKDRGALLEGDIISNSGANLQNGKWEVNMRMKPDASNKWSKITEENIGNYVAIILDGKVKSCPIINTKIDGGNSVISGNFSSSEAKDLSNILGSGKLKSKLRIIQQSVVGPSLGQSSIDSSVKSFIIALLIVLLYMIFYYYGAGMVSNVALIANIFFIFGVLASTGLVLTLPGIAGIVLTIGMSVDANVLIYERIREELINGKGIRLAIEDGYKSAYSSIIDANVTTLLVGIILYNFGEGPIKGFATTLIIGIITSLFCAIFITRLIISARLNKGKSMSFSTKLTKGAFKNLNIDFIGKRKVFYVLSAIVILFGGYSLSTKGLDYGIDFAGGRTYIVNMPNETITNDDIEESLSKVFVNEDGSEQDIQVSKFNDLTEKDSLDQKRAVNAVKITTKYMIDSDDENADEIVRYTLINGLNGLDGDYEFRDTKTYSDIYSYQKVASTIADDIRSSAWGSIIFSLLAIFLYIFIRFKKWQFSLGAVVAVFHDVLIVLSVFSIFYGYTTFALEIDQAFVAAILTIIGYSLNDTVVVFDRVREYMNDNKKKQVHEFINQSLNSTLSRTINTSITTFFVLLVIFLFGGEVIKGFMFALMVGVVVGTYSSLFVASPIMVDTIKRKEITNK